MAANERETILVLAFIRVHSRLFHKLFQAGKRSGIVCLARQHSGNQTRLKAGGRQNCLPHGKRRNREQTDG
jgi:hypothetical protein